MYQHYTSIIIEIFQLIESRSILCDVSFQFREEHNKYFLVADLIKEYIEESILNAKILFNLLNFIECKNYKTIPYFPIYYMHYRLTEYEIHYVSMCSDTQNLLKMFIHHYCNSTTCTESINNMIIERSYALFDYLMKNNSNKYRLDDKPNKFILQINGYGYAGILHSNVLNVHGYTYLLICDMYENIMRRIKLKKINENGLKCLSIDNESRYDGEYNHYRSYLLFSLPYNESSHKKLSMRIKIKQRYYMNYIIKLN